MLILRIMNATNDCNFCFCKNMSNIQQLISFCKEMVLNQPSREKSFL